MVCHLEDNISISKSRFVVSTTLFIIFIFFLGHFGLVNLYKLGKVPTALIAVVLLIMIVNLIIWQNKHRFFSLILGLLLWAVLGEIAEKLSLVNIVNFKNIFLLITMLFLAYYLIHNNLLSEFLMIAIVFFLTIWTSHFVLVNSFEQFGKTNIVTYLSSFVFLIFFVYFITKIYKLGNIFGLTLHTIFITCTLWSILEYLWAWKLIPKLWQ